MIAIILLVIAVLLYFGLSKLIDVLSEILIELKRINNKLNDRT